MKGTQKLPEAVQLMEEAWKMGPLTQQPWCWRGRKRTGNMEPEKPVRLYQHTANVFKNKEHLGQAAELLGKASRRLA